MKKTLPIIILNILSLPSAVTLAEDKPYPTYDGKPFVSPTTCKMYTISIGKGASILCSFGKSTEQANSLVIRVPGETSYQYQYIDIPVTRYTYTSFTLDKVKTCSITWNNHGSAPKPFQSIELSGNIDFFVFDH